MRFLLIGGTGYLGGRLSAYLKSQKHKVTIVTRRPDLAAPSLNADTVLHVKDYSGTELHHALADQDRVITLAGPDEIISQNEPMTALHSGVQGTWAILEALHATNPSLPLIYLSTFHVYGNHIDGMITEKTPPCPEHPYALGRYLGECVVQFFRSTRHMPLLCVRLSNAFGAPAHMNITRWSLLFNDLCRQAANTKQLVLKTSGTQERNFITMTDACRALDHLSQHTAEWPSDGIINVGSALQMSIYDAAERVASLCEKVLGYTPAIMRPSEKPGEKQMRFSFSTERLAHLGFSWQNNTDEEIQATLKMCAKAAAQPAPSQILH